MQNTYRQLPDRFYEVITPQAAPNPQLVYWNEKLADDLGFSSLDRNQLPQIFSGGILLAGSQPLAQAYAGHQFGHFQPQLGDGRALLLGEVLDINNRLLDVQLKGSGSTRFSRRGDGKAALGPMLREVIISEALFAMGIPTTRSLAVVSTGEQVHREESLPGAILTRIASSHLRVGTFEYFAARGDLEGLKILADFAIERHYPECQSTENPYVWLLKKVVEAQADLISSWMRVGFIHGVMNTDNTTISGESIDFGPCAFMDEYNPQMVFSSIDQNGRYAFSNQARIVHWNLQSLASCLLPLIHSDIEKAKQLALAELEKFTVLYHERYIQKMGEKLGLAHAHPEDESLITGFLSLLEKNKIDFTNGFGALAYWAQEKNSPWVSEEFQIETKSWREKWEARTRAESTMLVVLAKSNPIYLPRNHLVQRALHAAEKLGDFKFFQDLLLVVQKPFEERNGLDLYRKGPLEDERVTETFCGT